MIFAPETFFALATSLFCIGFVGVASRRNVFVIYMSIELMLNAVNLVLATFSRLRPDMGGSVIALLMIGVIAAEAALFLAMIVQLYRKKRSVDSDAFADLAHRRWS
ncbi:NADH-quinone oxidoreductase subunit NuoK [Hydrogenimonas urashimensis]|uniref:NADH-quinone oxidoreductase subunit NuoK n=1 Tax=Hydrogenimonas urashimensis TaxID=2740515 RepID=UPI0019160B2A|nr:NADH-quinone oxidoreductase subunit NuoK [Hydrogenimonas urashimensis]